MIIGIFRVREPVIKKNVENSTLGLIPPPMTESVENFQKKKLKKAKNLKNPIIRQFP